MANNYNTQVQWGGSSAPWNQGGVWTIGCRGPSQLVVNVDLHSDDENTLRGEITYSGEGPIGFQGTQTQKNHYTTQNQWGGNSAPWHDGGIWVIGDRPNQNVIKFTAHSSDNGKTLVGSIQYSGEGPISFKAQHH